MVHRQWKKCYCSIKHLIGHFFVCFWFTQTYHIVTINGHILKIGQIRIGNVPTAMLFDYIKVIGFCYQVKQNSICFAAKWYISIQNLSYLPGMHVWIHCVTDSNCSKSAWLRLSAHGQCACLRCQHLWYVGWGVQKYSVAILGLYSLRRRRRISIGIPIINLRPSSDRLRFIMGIPLPVRRHFF